MAKIVTTIDGIRGDIKIAIEDGKAQQTLELKWCVFDSGGLKGFIASFAQTPIIVTEVAAEHFIRIVIASLVRTFDLETGDLTILNHLGEYLPDVQFLPPTFEGNESDISYLVAAQDSLRRVYSIYEESGQLNSVLLNMAQDEGVVDDLLSLVQTRASGVFLTVRKPSQ
jgi:hypothetical protein